MKYYHYTSISTLNKMLDESLIIDEKTGVRYLLFHASHVSTLNDISERNMYINSFMDKVHQYAKNQNKKLNLEQKEKLRNLCYSDVYVISLSTCKDDLGMWRGYGGNGHGVCFEFDFSNVKPFNEETDSNLNVMEEGVKLMKCNYYYPKGVEIDTILVNQTYHYLLNHEQDKIKDTINKAGIMKQITEKAISCKHKAYECEQEYRYVTYNGMPFFSKEEDGSIRRSYVIKAIPLSAITAVIIGPCIKDSRNIVCLEQYLRMKLDKSTNILYSEIPYRG